MPDHLTTRRALAATVLAGAAATAPAFAAMAGPPACGPWTHFDVPEATGAPGLLYGVDVAADGTVFAVGRADRPAGSSTDAWPFAARWNGEDWDGMSIDNPSPLPVGLQSASFGDVAVLAADDAWAVGSYRRQAPDGFLGWQTLAMHWNGSGWSHVDTPLTPTGGTGADLRAIVATGPDDIWACGYRVAPEIMNVDTVGLLLHWDGSAWTELPTPPQLSSMQTFNGVHVLPGGTVWCVGSYGNAFGDNPYVARWDGSDWFVFEGFPIPPGLNGLEAIDGTGPDDLWMVGRTVPFDGSGQIALVMHWNGSFFEWESPVAPGLQSLRLEAVGVTPAGEVIAAGAATSTPPPAAPHPLIVRRTAAGWLVEADDPSGPSSAWFRGLAVTGDCEAWVVGQGNPFAGVAQRLGGHAAPADLDGDGTVGLADLLIVLAAWGPCPGCPADLDGSGAIDLGDLLAVLAAWS